MSQQQAASPSIDRKTFRPRLPTRLAVPTYCLRY